MLSSKCVLNAAVKKSRFMKEQEASGLLSSLIKTPLSYIPLLGKILF